MNGHRIRILGDFYNGAGFISGGSLIVSDDTFSRILGTAIRTPNAVLIRFSPNASARTVLGRLQKQLKGDAQVLTRQELKARERHFFMSVNPIGIMFTSGAVIAFLVGAVILYQILSTEVTHHLREYATLKAMGYTGQDLKFMVISRGIGRTAAHTITGGIIGVGIVHRLSAVRWGVAQNIQYHHPDSNRPQRENSLIIMYVLMTHLGAV